MPQRLTLAVFLMAFAVARPGDSADFRLRFTPPGEEPRPRAPLSAQRLAARAQQPTHALALPFYEVAAGDPSGYTTLVAVRNGSAAPIGIEVAYLPAQGGVHFEQVLLQGRATWTRNLRDVTALPVTSDGRKLGWASITAYDPTTLEDLEEPVIYGDTLVVTPGENFATGDQLGPLDQTCFFWDSRFMVGGLVDDNRFRLTMPFKSTTAFEPVAEVGVWDEEGTFFGVVIIEGDLAVGVITASDILSVVPGAPSFGAFEWEFLDHQMGGFLTLTINADGRFSMGLTPACVDGFFGL